MGLITREQLASHSRLRILHRGKTTFDHALNPSASLASLATWIDNATAEMAGPVAVLVDRPDGVTHIVASRAQGSTMRLPLAGS